eukprot:1742237-Rhodomonas_salina.1
MGHSKNGALAAGAGTWGVDGHEGLTAVRRWMVGIVCVVSLIHGRKDAVCAIVGSPGQAQQSESAVCTWFSLPVTCGGVQEFVNVGTVPLRTESGNFSPIRRVSAD